MISVMNNVQNYTTLVNKSKLKGIEGEVKNFLLPIAQKLQGMSSKTSLEESNNELHTANRSLLNTKHEAFALHAGFKQY